MRNPLTTSPSPSPPSLSPSLAIRSRKRWLRAIVCLAIASPAVALTLATPAAASTVTRPHPVPANRADTPTANKALVLRFADELFNKANLAVIDEDTDGYIQHNPTVADGPDGLRNLVVFLHGLFPDSHTTFERVIAQGDLVLLQDKVVTTPGTAGQQIIDIYRVERNKIVEHWDNLEPVPASSVNGHDLFSTLSAPHTSTPDPRASTRLSAAVVRRYYHTLRRNHICAGGQLVALNLIQHDPTIADGAAATNQHYSDLFARYPQARFTIARIVAEGDFVAVHAHFQKTPDDLGQSIVDIYRVQHRRIVEHWNGTQNVPATAANNNTMF